MLYTHITSNPTHCFTTFYSVLSSFNNKTTTTMAGVWIFDKGVARLVTNPTRESFEQRDPPYPGTATAPGARPKVLVYLPTNEVVRSYDELEHRLGELGWTRYRNPVEPELLQFHRSNDSAHLISLPKSFCNFKPLHMYDIVVKNRSFFEVRDPMVQDSSYHA